MQLKKQSMERVFNKLEVRDIVSNDHVRGKVRLPSGHVVRLRYSHGRGDIPGPVVHRIRRQLGLSLAEFSRLVECTMSASEWTAIAEQRLPGPL
jgi:hypothetical protein